MKTLTIDIYENSDGDFNYEIYECPEDLENGEDPINGGTCTTTIENTLEMAYEQAKDVLKNYNNEDDEDDEDEDDIL